MTMMTLYAKKNAGKLVKTRWGEIQFNESGMAQYDIPETDRPMVESLKWLTNMDEIVAAQRAIQEEKRRLAMKTDPVAERGDPTPNEIKVYKKENAKKIVKTRWGDVSFDADGFGIVTVPTYDLHKLQSLGWIFSPEVVAAIPPEVKPQTPSVVDVFAGKNAIIADLEACIAERDRVIEMLREQVADLTTQKDALQTKTQALEDELESLTAPLSSNVEMKPAEQPVVAIPVMTPPASAKDAKDKKENKGKDK